jgi:hypothetical protein
MARATNGVGNEEENRKGTAEAVMPTNHRNAGAGVPGITAPHSLNTLNHTHLRHQ